MARRPRVLTPHVLQPVMVQGNPSALDISDGIRLPGVSGATGYGRHKAIMCENDRLAGARGYPFAQRACDSMAYRLGKAIRI
ncbi:MAG TPA: hypothetical protein VN666_20815 [Nitrospira sp.]|nr:hypothetical protein [Nitrospira sp.]